jgi:hypothetical protein
MVSRRADAKVRATHSRVFGAVWRALPPSALSGERRSTGRSERMIALLRQVADPGNAEGARWAGMRVHSVRSTLMVDLGWSSKLNAEWDFLVMLRYEGRRAADIFLAEHGAALGHRSSVDLHSVARDLSREPRRRPARPWPPAG